MSSRRLASGNRSAQSADDATINTGTGKMTPEAALDIIIQFDGSPSANPSNMVGILRGLRVAAFNLAVEAAEYILRNAGNYPQQVTTLADTIICDRDHRLM